MTTHDPQNPVCNETGEYLDISHGAGIEVKPEKDKEPKQEKPAKPTKTARK